MTIFEKHEQQVKEYLNKYYPDLIESDIERMEICENGDVYIGWAVINTGIKLEF